MTAWTKPRNPSKPRVWSYYEPQTADGGGTRWAWRCDEHERLMTGYRTQAEAMDRAAHHHARRH